MNRKLADESYTGDEYLIGIKIYFSLVKIGVMRLLNSSTEFKFRFLKKCFEISLTRFLFTF